MAVEFDNLENLSYFLYQKINSDNKLTQLFDEGENVVTMILPEGIELLKQKKLLEEKEQLEKLKLEMKLKEDEQTITTEEVIIEKLETAPLISDKVPDVEYEDDYDRFNEIASMDFKTEAPVEEKIIPETEEIREYAIDMWNGSPGLKMWGYNDTDK